MPLAKFISPTDPKWLATLDALTAVCLPKMASTLVIASGPYRAIRDLDPFKVRPSSRIAEDNCGMMARRAATTGVPRCDERAHDPAAAADERPGQGRRDPRPTPPAHGAATP